MENKFTKACSNCGRIQEYTTEKGRDNAEKSKSKCRKCAKPKNLEIINHPISRKCPVCEKILNYVSNEACYYAEKAGNKCRSCVNRELKKGNKYWIGKKHSEKTKKRMKKSAKNKDKSFMLTQEWKDKRTKALKGKTTKSKGKTMLQIMIEVYGEDEGKKRNDLHSKRLSRAFKGKNNPMYGKPSPQGSGNGWSGWYKKHYFRSIRELSYIVDVLEKENLSWVSGEGLEKIKYKDPLKNERTYVADFLVDNHFLIEIKPLKLHESKIVKCKQKAAIKWCKKQGFEYKLIDVEPLKKEKIVELYRNETLKWNSRYENKFLEKYGDII